jgi:tRNA threonylcarbamoyladenosine modification (KEOPS) complex Cgi121 subunit
MTEVCARCYTVKDCDPVAFLSARRRENARLVIQGFSKWVTTNESFVEMVAAQTLHAIKTGNLLAGKPEIDLLLRVAGTTQIATAISKIGAKKGEAFVVAFAGPRQLLSELKEGAGWTRLPRNELTEAELGRIERAALLNARKR